MLIILMSNYVLLFAELKTQSLGNAETSVSDHCNSEVNTALCANTGVYRVATIIDHKTQCLCASKDFLIDMFVQYVTGRNQGRENHFKLHLAKLHANRNLQLFNYTAKLQTFKKELTTLTLATRATYIQFM